MAHSIQEILLPALYILACVFGVIVRRIFIRQNQLAKIIFATQTPVWSVCQSAAGFGLVKTNPATNANVKIYAALGPMVKAAMRAANVQLGDQVTFSVDPAEGTGATIESFRCTVLSRA